LWQLHQKAPGRHKMHELSCRIARQQRRDHSLSLVARAASAGLRGAPPDRPRMPPVSGRSRPEHEMPKCSNTSMNRPWRAIAACFQNSLFCFSQLKSGLPAEFRHNFRHG
jgi:hypothetical protein